MARSREGESAAQYIRTEEKRTEEKRKCSAHLLLLLLELLENDALLLVFAPASTKGVNALDYTTGRASFSPTARPCRPQAST